MSQSLEPPETGTNALHTAEGPINLLDTLKTVSSTSFIQSLPERLRIEALLLPIPGLVHDFRVSVTLCPKISVGVTPFGTRNWISFTGGQWSATWGKGKVVPGGQDNQLVTSDLSTKISTNYLLETSDNPPAYITIHTSGWRTGPKDVLAALFDPSKADHVDPKSYKFRLYIDLETGDERYAFINTGMWIASGIRKGAEVVYDAYRVT